MSWLLAIAPSAAQAATRRRSEPSAIFPTLRAGRMWNGPPDGDNLIRFAHHLASSDGSRRGYDLSSSTTGSWGIGHGTEAGIAPDDGAAQDHRPGSGPP